MVEAWLFAAVAGALALALAWWGTSSLRSSDALKPKHPKGKPLPTRDGGWVASKGEQAIANYLSRNATPYLYEPTVAGGLTPDFQIEGTKVVIEYWGLASEPPYEERMLEKIDQYEEHGFEVINLFPAHLHEIDEVLEQELWEKGLLHEEG